MHRDLQAVSAPEEAFPGAPDSLPDHLKFGIAVHAAAEALRGVGRRRRALPESRGLAAPGCHRAAARRGVRCALRSKNRAWLITADTVAGWNGLAIRKAGSGRSPVRNRSG